MHTKLICLTLAGMLAAGTAAAAPDHTLGMALLSAVIESDGSVIRGSGVTGASKITTSETEVDFDRDVTDCTYVVNTAGSENGAVLGFAPAAKISGKPNALFVVTNTPADVDASLPFQLIVFCSK